MGSGEDRRRVFTNEIWHLTAVKAEQLRNQANRVSRSRVDSTSSCERPIPWVTEWYTHWVCYPVCQRPIPETHTRHHANHANHACTKQDTRSTIIPCIKQRGVCDRGRLLAFCVMTCLAKTRQARSAPTCGMKMEQWRFSKLDLPNSFTDSSPS